MTEHHTDDFVTDAIKIPERVWKAIDAVIKEENPNYTPDFTVKGRQTLLDTCEVINRFDHGGSYFTGPDWPKGHIDFQKVEGFLKTLSDEEIAVFAVGTHDLGGGAEYEEALRVADRHPDGEYAFNVLYAIFWVMFGS